MIMGKNQYGEWMNEKDINFIRDNYKSMTNSEIAKILGRCEGSIKFRLRKLGLKKGHILTEDEINFMKENYMTMSYRDISKRLNISRDLVKYKMLKELKLKKRTTIPHYYTKEENKFIEENYLKKKNKELAKSLGVSTDSIHNQLTKLNIARNFTWSGEMSSNWQGGFRRPHKTNFAKEMNNLVHERDKQSCIICGKHSDSKKLPVHHINYDNHNHLFENMITLCDSCHTKTNFSRTHWINFFHSLLSEKYGYKYQEGDIILNINWKEKNGKI